MSERVAASFQRSVVLLLAGLSVALATLAYFVEDGIARLVIAAASFFLLRRIWRATRRKRELGSRGFHAGHRSGNHWVYEELHHGEVVAIELPLAYVGRGEYEILIPGQSSWSSRVPAWARDRRAEIVERLGTVFKHSEMRSDD